VDLRLHAGILCSEGKRCRQCRRSRALKKLSSVHLNLNLPESKFIPRILAFRPWRLRDLRGHQSLFTLFERLAQRAAIAPAW
jgi:hypothetical protein